MADDPMNSLSFPDAEPVEAEFALLDAQISQALETAPPFAIPATFAARVAAIASEGSAVLSTRRVGVPITVRHYGRNAAIVSLCILLGMMLLFARRTTGTSHVWISAEIIFCLQFALLAVWLVTRDLRSYFSWTSQG